MRRAQCCCGGCRITVAGDPVSNVICHCQNCKRRTGSAFGWSAYFRDDQVLQTLGEYGVYELHKPCHQQRSFCLRCGTTLFWKADDFAGMTGIAGGCFVDPPLPSPNMAVSNDQHCQWVTLPAQWAAPQGRSSLS